MSKLIGGWTNMDEYSKEEEAWKELENRPKAPKLDPIETQTFGPLGVDSILDERGKRYGKFRDHAAATQAIKAAIRHGLINSDNVLADDQQEALEMIAHKIGRIVNGDPDYADSWVDIAGYAQLVADRLHGRER